MATKSTEVIPSAAQMLESAKPSPDDTFIAVMGVTGAGKSTFISKCCGDAIQGIGHGLESTTQEIQIFTYFLGTRKIHLIDTPGFNDTYRTDSDVLRDLAYWLTDSFNKGFRLTGIIYLHPIQEKRMSGSAFKNLRTFQKLCGKQSMETVVLVTTMWSEVSGSDGDSREAELKSKETFWKGMIDQGSSAHRHTGDSDSAMAIIGHLLAKSEGREPMVVELQNEMAVLKKDLDRTEAGREIDGEMIKQREAYERRLQDSKLDMEEAIANMDKEHIEQVAKDQERMRAHIDAIEKGREDMRTSMEQLIKDTEARHRREIEEFNKKLAEKDAEAERKLKEHHEYKITVEAEKERDRKQSAEKDAELERQAARIEEGELDQFILAKVTEMVLEQREQEKSASAKAAKAESKRKAEERQQQDSMSYQRMIAEQQRQYVQAQAAEQERNMYYQQAFARQQAEYAYANQQAQAQAQQMAMMGAMGASSVGTMAGMSMAATGCSIM